MIDTPPEPTPSQEQVIERKLLDCGLKAGGFAVRYEDELQSIEVVIRSVAGAGLEHFACIREVAFPEIVTFEEPTMFQQYMDFEAELARPQVLADVEASLKERGLWDNFPARSRFATFAEYVQALEAHAGFTPGTILQVEGEGLVTVYPLREEPISAASTERVGVLLMVLHFASARDRFDIGLIGNDKVRE